MSIEQKKSMNGSAKAPAQKPPETTASTPITASLVCPFIGLEDDPSTRLLFVSPAAHCHRADPTSAINLNHQQEYCLSSVHKLCPVFMAPEWVPLPTELEFYEPVKPPSRRGWLWMVVGLMIAGLMIGFLFVRGSDTSSLIAETEPENNLPVVIVPATSTLTQTPMAESTKTAVPSPTARPTNTPQVTVTDIPSVIPTQVPTVAASATLVPTYTPVPPTKTVEPLIQAIVAVPFLNIRSGPGTLYELMATISENEQIELTGRVTDSSWWQICCVNGETGWVIGEAIEVPAEAEIKVPIINGIPLPPTPTE